MAENMPETIILCGMTKEGITEGTWIDRQDTLQAFLDAVRPAPWLTFDTEFLRTRTYYPDLCLIQISDGTQHALIDAHAGLDLTGLTEWMQRGCGTCVLHACLQDVEILHHYFSTIPEDVFDTQLAWSLLGHGYQTGYAAIVKHQLGITLDKSQVRSRWDRRPLTPAQMNYALADVTHLAPVYRQLVEQLEAHGRMAWLREEMGRMLDPSNWIPDPDQIWKRVRLSGSSVPKDRLHVLQGLARWRELTARRHNRARPRVAPDQILGDLARTPPGSRKSFNHTVSETVYHRLHDELWNALQEAQDLPPLPLPSIGHAERTEQKRKVRLLAETTRKVAGDLQVSPELLAPRAMLESLVRQQPDPALVSGWRRQTIEPILRETLDAL